jgi:HAD superfamily phosphoserine phosphatase-like hydrolase
VSAFASVILDADSTLAGIEGVDWLATLRGDEVARQVAALTDDAMAGRIGLEAVFTRRMELIAPTEREIGELARAYVDAVAPDARAALAELRRAGVALRVVSGGLLQALLPLTRALGFDDAEVHAVEVRFDRDGDYDGVVPSPLTTQTGKARVAKELALPRRVLAVGDGATDLAMRPAVDAFAAYTGFVRRDAVVARADVTVTSFRDVADVVLANA